MKYLSIKALRISAILGIIAFVTVALLLKTGAVKAAPLATNCKWKAFSTVMPTGAVSTNFVGEAAIASTNVWAVGYYIDASSNVLTLIEQWNGQQWSVVSSPNPTGATNNHLVTASATSANDVWAAGYYFDTTTNTNEPLIEHWDGTSWSIISSPNTGTPNNLIAAITAISTSDAWVVGSADTTNGQNTQPLLEHWNGTQWKLVTAPTPSQTVDNSFTSVAALSATSIWVVGSSYTTSQTTVTLTEHLSGTKWSVIASPSPGTGSLGSLLNGVTTLSSGNVWAVGQYYPSNSSTSEETLVEHWTGSRWKVVTSPNSPSGVSGNGLFSVTSETKTNIWAVGAYYDSQSNSQVLAEHWNGKTWNIVNAPNPGTLENLAWSVARIPATSRVWLVGFTSGSAGSGQALSERYC
ncbi:MAG: hypothetical protein WCD86_05770 [Ktedonobacteraceae bacterium]